MKDTIQIKRGLEANLPRLADGELALTEDTYKVFVGTSGGNQLIAIKDVNALLGDLTQLQTVDKDTLVHAINDNVTSLADIANNVYNIKSSKYGAKGDGVTDDSNAFVSLFQDLNTAGGGRVDLPSGTYVINTVPNFASLKNVLFIARGLVTLKFTFGGTYNSDKIFKQMDTVAFFGVTFSSPNAHLFSIFGDNANLKKVSFFNCTVIDCTPNFFVGAYRDILFHNCDWTQSATPPATLQGSIGGVQTGQFVVDKCRFNFAFNGASGTLVIVATNAPVLAGLHACITDCEFLTDNLTGYTMDAAIDSEPSGTVQIESLTIRGCKFYNCRTYLTGAKFIDVDGCYYRWTSVGQSQANACQLDIYNSSGTQPDTGTLRIRNTDVVQDANSSSTYQTQIAKIQRNVNKVILENLYLLMNGSGTSGLNPIFEFAGGTVDRLIFDNVELDVNVNAGGVSTLLFDASTINHLEFRNSKVNKQWQHLFAFGQGSAATIQTFKMKDNDFSNLGLSTGTIKDAWLWVNGGNTTFTNTIYENNIGLNPTGNVTPTLPASGVAYTNNLGYAAMVTVSGGTVSQIAIGGQNTGLTSGAFVVPVGTTITVTYSVAPTWLWMGL